MSQADVDISSLGGKSGQLTPRPVLQVEARGTDEMRFVRQRVEMGARNNQPLLDGKNVDVLDYKAHLMSGFSNVYRLVMEYREELLSGPIAQFAHDETRFIMRATRTYDQLLYESYQPDFLRDTLERDIFFDRLWVNVQNISQLKRVIAAERADLHVGDILFFTTRPNTCDVYTSRGECIADFITTSGLDLVKQRGKAHILEYTEMDVDRCVLGHVELRYRFSRGVDHSQ